MQIEAVGRPLRYRLLSGQEIMLRPGCPVEVSQPTARSLLRQVPDRVRVVADASGPEVVIEPAAPESKPVFWESSDGRIQGPAQPEFLVQVGLGLRSVDFWVIAHNGITPIWIRSDRLRSMKQFETQRPLRETKLIR